MTNTLLYLYAVVFGLVMGSFLNVVIVRDTKRKSIMTGRSQCPSCKHVLNWYELIPVVSFLLQGAKCRSCKKALSWQYPLAEVVTAGLSLFVTWYSLIYYHSTVLFIGMAISCALFLVVSGVDLLTMEIPIDYVVIAGIIGGVARWQSGTATLTEVALGLITGAGIIAFILYGWRLIFKQDGMGTGDIWMAGALGAVAAYPLSFSMLLYAVITGAVIGIIAMLIQKKGFEAKLPFGPFLFIGFLLSLVWGQAILQWYIL
jgi:leader peptidase (prepilin peptidase)/N-methyltransferase